MKHLFVIFKNRVVFILLVLLLLFQISIPQESHSAFVETRGIRYGYEEGQGHYVIFEYHEHLQWLSYIIK